MAPQKKGRQKMLGCFCQIVAIFQLKQFPIINIYADDGKLFPERLKYKKKCLRYYHFSYISS